ncbi:hypothetical protein TNCV_106321 [Trichonephila clavipes]|nr:hypothetical protein TNCV_106321 [Trichonephila clavipes]
MPPVGRCQIEAHEIHRGNSLEVRLSLAVGLRNMQLGYTHILWKNTLLLFPFHQLDNYLEYPPCRKGTIHPFLLQDSNPGPTAQQSASPNTTPKGILNDSEVTKTTPELTPHLQISTRCLCATAD